MERCILFRKICIALLVVHIWSFSNLSFAAEQDNLVLFFQQVISDPAESRSATEYYRQKGYDFERLLYEAFTGELSLDSVPNENVSALSQLGFFLTKNHQVQFTQDYAAKFAEHLKSHESKYSNKGYGLRRVLLLEIETHVIH